MKRAEQQIIMEHEEQQRVSATELMFTRSHSELNRICSDISTKRSSYGKRNIDFEVRVMSISGIKNVYALPYHVTY